MKARILNGWILTTLLAGGVATSGFAQEGVNPAPATVLPEKTGVAAPAPASAEPVPPGTPSQAAQQPSTSATAADQARASSPYASPWYYEIERLLKAQVEDSVILAYIFNSAGTFNITAEQVIALKNLGAAPQVISAMMQHDRQLLSGERPLTASTPPPFSASVQAAINARLYPDDQPSAPPVAAAVPAPAPPPPTAAPEEESGTADTLVWAEPGYPPDPPQGLYPVRLPYPVKLNDPIIMLRLPSFALPCR
jgi:hypothetical protein